VSSFFIPFTLIYSHCPKIESQHIYGRRSNTFAPQEYAALNSKSIHILKEKISFKDFNSVSLARIWVDEVIATPSLTIAML
jgi:hypothetical protein